ncbi:MAG: energy transducer TonB [Alkalispirochaeta sp.]
MEEIQKTQEDYLEALKEWETRQQRLSDRTSASATDPAADPTADPTTTPQSTATNTSPGFTTYQDALSRMIAGIESSDNNVIRTNPGATPGTTPDPTPGSGPATSDGTAGPGIAGVTVGDGVGRRQLVKGSSPDLSHVQLPPGFPPEYLVVVTFQVGSDGVVRSAQLQQPTPVPELDALLRAAVQSWRFEPAPASTAGGSSVARGSVTIVVDTR